MADATTKLLLVLEAQNKTKGAFSELTAELNKQGKLLAALPSIAAKAAAGYIGLAGIGKIISMTTESLNQMRELGRNAADFGIPVDQLAKLKAAAEQSGIGLDRLRDGWKDLSEKIIESQDPTSKSAELFRQLGIATQDASGNVRPLSEIFLEVSDRFKDFSNGPAKVNLAKMLFGGSGIDFIDLLNKGRVEIERMGSSVHGLITENDVTMAKDYARQISLLNSVASGLKYEATRAIAPQLTKIMAFYSTALFGTTAFQDWLNSELEAEFGKAGKSAGTSAAPTVIDPKLRAEAAQGQMDSAANAIKVAQSFNSIKLGEIMSNQFFTKGEQYLRAQVYYNKQIESIDQERNLIKDQLVDLEMKDQDLKGRIEPLEGQIDKEGQRLALEKQRYDVQQKMARLSIDQNNLEGQRYDLQQRLTMENPYNFSTQTKLAFNQLYNQWGTIQQMAAGTMTQTLGGAVNSFSSEVTKAILVTGDFGKAWQNVGLMIAQVFIELVVKMAVLSALSAIMPGFGIGKFFGFADGGLVPGAPSGQDNRIATVATGEYVVRSAAVQHYGPGLFEALNSMQMPRMNLGDVRMPASSVPRLGYADGGLVSGLGGGINVASGPVHVAFVNTQEQFDQFMRQHGDKHIMDVITRKKLQLGMRS